jgi:FkbM family methyltransferase
LLLDPNNFFKLFSLDTGPVIHVGAHEAEERKLYTSLNLTPRIWIEAQPDLVSKLREKFDSPEDQILQGAVWSSSGALFNLNIASNSQSSSLLELGSHSKNYPDITYVGTVQVKTIVLEDVLAEVEYVAFLNLDIQGAELQALKGAGDELAKVQAIYTEVNFEEVYKECPLVSEIDSYLLGYGFRRVLTYRTQAGWGDALYLRLNKLMRLSVRLLSQKSALRWLFYRQWFTAKIYSKLGKSPVIQSVLRAIRRQH